MQSNEYKSLPKNQQSEFYLQERHAHSQIQNGLLHFQKELKTDGRICCKPEEYGEIRSALVKMPWFILGNINRGSRYITIIKNDNQGTKTEFAHTGNAIIHWNSQEEGVLTENDQTYRTSPGDNLCAQLLNAYHTTQEIRERQEDVLHPLFTPNSNQPQAPDINSLQLSENNLLQIPQINSHSRSQSGFSSISSRGNHGHQRISSSGIVDSGNISREPSDSSEISEAFTQMEAFVPSSSSNEALGWTTINGQKNFLSYNSNEMKSGPVTSWSRNAFATGIHQNVGGEDVFHWLRNDIMEQMFKNNLYKFYQNLNNSQKQEIPINIGIQDGRFSIGASQTSQQTAIITSQGEIEEFKPIIPPRRRYQRIFQR